MTHSMAIRLGEQSLHKQAQRLRWVLKAFEQQVDVTSDETGNRFCVDTGKLTEAFAIWLKSFEAQKPLNSQDNQAYVGFAAGLMLRALIRHNPVKLVATPENPDLADPANFWPEGYLYVAFCLNVRGLILQSDYRSEQRPSEILREMRTWWSFKENSKEDPSTAIAFLDLFAGNEPKWSFPDIFNGL